MRPRTGTDSEPEHRELARLLAEYQRALPASPAEAYLRHRGIPLEVARALRVGYAPPGGWAHRGRDWREGRLVVPHTDPQGRLVNLYGRAVENSTQAPRSLRHDHLPGPKGYFNAEALASGLGAVFVCEGPFDALSLVAAGYRRAVALFGLSGWRWEWFRAVDKLVLGLDADPAGERAWRMIARQACLRGKRVAILGPQAYGGKKDINEAWCSGCLAIGSWPYADDSPAPGNPGEEPEESSPGPWRQASLAGLEDESFGGICLWD